MQLHKLVLPGGGVVASGSGEEWAIISVKLRQSVNSGSEFRLGSVCAAQARVELFAPADGVILPGTELELWQGDTKVGIFLVQKALRPSRGRLQLSLTDRAILLEREVTQAVEELTGWPYTLSEFVHTVAGLCGLELEEGEIPNGELPIDAFRQGILTGTELMGWCAELAGCFCHVTAEGKLRFGRYTPSGITLQPTGEHFYYRDSLTLASAPAEDILGVQLRDPDNDHLLPVYGEGASVYVIEGNPLTRHVAWPHLMGMLGGFPRGCTVGAVEIPDWVPVQVGQTVEIFDGLRTVTLPIMERTVENGRQRLCAMGSAGKLDSISSQARTLAKQLSIARQAVDAQTQAEIFNKLTDYGKAQGIFLQDGQLYINASFLSAGILDAAVVQVVNLIAQRLCSVLEESSLEIDGAQLRMLSDDRETVLLSNEFAGHPILYLTDREDGEIVHKAELSPHHLRLGGSDSGGVLYLGISGGEARLDLEQGNPRTLSWTYDSALGKYVLTGS